MPPVDANMIWAAVAVFLTLLVLVGYLIGKSNFLFRLVAYLFIGVTAGYAVVVILYQLFLPRIIRPLLQGPLLLQILAAVPLVLGLLLLAKLSPRLAGLGNIPMAYLLGVGAAVLMGGALFGTLMGQVRASAAPFGSPNQFLEGAFTLVGTICTLAYFSYGARSKANQAPRRPVLVDLLGKVGQVFIAITLGAVFAGVFSASIVALVERLGFILSFIRDYLL